MPIWVAGRLCRCAPRWNHTAGPQDHTIPTEEAAACSPPMRSGATDVHHCLLALLVLKPVPRNTLAADVDASEG